MSSEHIYNNDNDNNDNDNPQDWQSHHSTNSYCAALSSPYEGETVSVEERKEATTVGTDEEFKVEEDDDHVNCSSSRQQFHHPTENRYSTTTTTPTPTVRTGTGIFSDFEEYIATDLPVPSPSYQQQQHTQPQSSITSTKREEETPSSPYKVNNTRNEYLFSPHGNNLTPKEIHRREQIEAKWDEMFDKLFQYKTQHGHCSIISSSPEEEEENKTLKLWVNRQRSAFNCQKLREDRFKRLEGIGFCWKPGSGGGGGGGGLTAKKDAHWHGMFDKLQNYKKQHGDCLVPSQSEDNKKLAKWVNHQRCAYKKNKLLPERKNKLESLGFVWNALSHQTRKNYTTTKTDARWEEMYNRLVAYKDKHGNCNVPPSYKDPQDEPGKKLASWVNSQRSKYKLQQIRPDRKSRLDTLGFIWNNDQKWDEMFARLEIFKQKYNDCLVPMIYPTDPALGKWVATQRRMLHLERMKEERKKKLEDIGFVWKVCTNAALAAAIAAGDVSAADAAAAAGSNVQDIKIIKGNVVDSEERQETKWEEMFQRLKDYTEQHGDYLTPSNDVVEDKQLATWVYTQRVQYKLKQLKQNRQEKMESINFVWEPRLKKDRWDEMYNRLQEYKRQHGNCLVPQLYAEDKALGSWVASQRAMYKCKQLKPDRQKRLDDIDFVWSVKEIQEWEDMFQRLKDYKEQNGDCLIPHNYHTDKDLGDWLDTQRIEYKLRKMKYQRKERLESLGVVWSYNRHGTSLLEKKWDDMFGCLQDYKEKHGDCLVPKVYEENKSLGSWVAKQRIDYKKKKLRADRQKLLDSIGFTWSARTRERQDWDDMFTRLEQYKRQHRDCYVPQKYSEDKELGFWVNTQRQHYRLKKMEQYRIERLESIDFVWKILGKPKLWDQMFQRLQDYKEKYGDVLVRQHRPGHKELRDWVNTQRSVNKANKMKPYRKELLDSIGFIWDIDDVWNEMFRQLEQFKEKYGHCVVPGQYGRNRALGSWVVFQRQVYKGKRMKPDRLQRLKSIDFVWNVKGDAQKTQDWDEMLERLQAYKDEHGDDCLTQQDHVFDDRTLGLWVNTQRFLFESQLLDAGKYQRLESIGFVAHTQVKEEKEEGQDWDGMFERLQSYKEKHGSCVVPPSSDEHRDLFEWINTQRSFYKVKKMDAHKQDRLNAIDFVWNVRASASAKDAGQESDKKNKEEEEEETKKDNEWNEMFQRLQLYKDQHGDCHVPLRYAGDRELSCWVFSQRSLYRLNNLQADKREYLESVGFLWSRKEEIAEWEEMFQRLQEYKREHGSCLVSEDYDDGKLLDWINAQRCSYKLKTMKADTQKRLESIGFVWNGPTTKKRNKAAKKSPAKTEEAADDSNKKWNEMFQQLQSYKKQHGDCLVSSNYDGDKELGVWVTTQRSAFRLKNLKADRQKRLESIGFTWVAPTARADSGSDEKAEQEGAKASPTKKKKKAGINDATWNEMFKRLENYKEHHGDCLVPARYDGDKKLGVWCCTQRSFFRMKTLKPDRHERLNSIGFAWRLPAGKAAAAVASGKRDRHEDDDVASKPYAKRSKADVHNDEMWNEVFKRLQSYKEKHGDCLVPARCAEDNELGMWVTTQRTLYRLKKIKAERQERLESIDFVWNIKPNPIEGWEEMFQRLQRFKEKYGHCLVPARYALDKLLGGWVSTQRTVYRRGKMSDDRRNRLESIGFIWNVERKTRR